MGIGYHMHELPRLQSRNLREHHEQDRVLHDVPVVCREHVVGALVEYAVERVARDVERHGIGARIEVHFVQVGKSVNVGEYPAAGGIVFKVVEHPVHLVELALAVLVFYAELVAVRFAYTAVFVRPLVPDMGMEVMDVVALLLPYPQYLVYARAECRAPYGQDGKFL